MKTALVGKAAALVAKDSAAIGLGETAEGE